MNGGRVHTGTQIGTATVSVIATWGETAPMADVEEAIKAAAREAVTRARATRQERQ